VSGHGKVTLYPTCLQRCGLMEVIPHVFKPEMGYDNAHDGHHRHLMGVVEPINFTTFEDVEERLECDWTALQEQK
jgi:5-methylthioribose kinase